MIIKREGATYYVATAWHVIESNGNNEEIDIVTPDGKRHTTYGSKTKQGDGDNNDIGIITFESENDYQVAKIMPDIASLNRNLSNTNTEGEPLGLAGFPLSQDKFRYSIGVLVAYAVTGIDRGYELLYTNKTSAGMSGGPILNRQGFLIGIHGRGDRDQVAIQKRGLSENTKTAVNQGVPINYIHPSIKFGPLTPKEPERFRER